MSNSHPSSLANPSTSSIAMSTIQEIASLADWDKHVSSLPPTTLLIVSFHAPWAAPCAQMATVLKTLAAEYPVIEPPSTSWVSVNAEDLSDLSEKYDVTAVPFLVLLRGGEVVETVSGSKMIPVREAIERHASKTTAETNGDNNIHKPEKAAADAVDAPPVEPEATKEELFKRLGELVKAAPVMLFMKGTPSAPQCGFSRQVVGILRDNSVKYGFFNILADDEVRQGLKEYADWPTYPQLWMNGELIGGLDIVSFLPFFFFFFCRAMLLTSYSTATRLRRRWATTKISSRNSASPSQMGILSLPLK